MTFVYRCTESLSVVAIYVSLSRWTTAIMLKGELIGDGSVWDVCSCGCVEAKAYILYGTINKRSLPLTREQSFSQHVNELINLEHHVCVTVWYSKSG